MIKSKKRNLLLAGLLGFILTGLAGVIATSQPALADHIRVHLRGSNLNLADDLSPRLSIILSNGDKKWTTPPAETNFEYIREATPGGARTIKVNIDNGWIARSSDDVYECEIDFKFWAVSEHDFEHWGVFTGPCTVDYSQCWGRGSEKVDIHAYTTKDDKNCYCYIEMKHVPAKFIFPEQ